MSWLSHALGLDKRSSPTVPVSSLPSLPHGVTLAQTGDDVRANLARNGGPSAPVVPARPVIFGDAISPLGIGTGGSPAFGPFTPNGGDAVASSPLDFSSSFSLTRPDDEPAWSKECRAKGGIPFHDEDGYPMCSLGSGPVAPTVFNGFSIVSDFSRFGEKSGVIARDTPLTPGSPITGGDVGTVISDAPAVVTDAVTGAAHAVLSFPRPVVIAVAVLSIYALGVQVGILPSLRKVIT